MVYRFYCFGVCSEAEYHDREHVARQFCFLYGGWEAKGRERKGPEPTILFKGMLPMS